MESRQYIEFKIMRQKIARTDDFEVVGGSKGYVYARFTFCEDWQNEKIKYAIFTGGGHPYPMLIEDGICEVPWEVLRFKKFYVGCVAGELLTSDAAVVDVTPCGVDLLDPNLEPTPTLFYAIMKKLQNAERVTEEQINEAVKKYLDENPTAGGGDADPVILALGDSLCAGIRNNNKGFVGDIGLPYVNKGRDNATLGKNKYANSDPRTFTLTIRNQLSEAYEEGIMPDIIIADGCINDYGQSCALGTVPTKRAESENDFTNIDVDETLGGLQRLFFDMWKHYPKARKFFIIPHKLNKVTVYGATEAVDFMTTENEHGYTLTDYYDAVKATCAVYSIEVIDVCNESGIDMTDSKYNPGYSWQENSNNPNRDFETSTIWLDQDSHPFEYGYTHGYLPLIHKALFVDVPEAEIVETSNNPFFVPIKYNGTAYTLDKITASEIESAYRNGAYLVAKVRDLTGDNTDDPAVYYAPLIERSIQQSGAIRYDFSNSNSLNPNPNGRGLYTILTNGIGAQVWWFTQPIQAEAKNILCKISVNGVQKTNVDDALSAIVNLVGALGIAEEVAY